MSAAERKEWVSLRHTPTRSGPNTRITVTIKEGGVSASWAVPRFGSDPVKPAVAEAYTRADTALAELAEALAEVSKTKLKLVEENN